MENYFLYSFIIIQLFIMIIGFILIKRLKKKITQKPSTTSFSLGLESSFFNIIPTALFITNISGEIRFINDKFCKLFGEEKKSLLKKNIFNYFDYNSNNPLKEEIANSKKKIKLKTWIEKQNRDAIFVNLDLIRLEIDSFSNDSVYLGIFQDITSSMMKTKQKKEYTEGLENRLSIRNKDLVEINKKLANKNNDLIKANTSKNIFFANVSHELRTPLVAVCGYVEMLLDEQFGPINNKIRKAFTASNDNLNRLTDFINNLLDLARIESFQDNLNYTNINTGKITNEIFLRFQSISIKKNIELINKITKDSPDIYVDIRHIDQVLSNLISNAIKFTDEGKIIVKANETIDNKLKIEVIDTGCGIPDEKKQLIFDRFYRAERKSISKEKGSGLGLAIVKEILNRYNSTVKVKDNNKKGTIFSFTLPTIKKEKKVTQHTGKILLVSNNETQNEIIASVTGQINLTTSIVNTGLAAIEMVEKYKYDIIFTDNILSDLEGIELCKMLNDRISHEYTPIYIMTFPVNTAERNKMLLAGARGIITRPFNAKAIKRVLNQEIIINQSVADKTK